MADLQRNFSCSRSKSRLVAALMAVCLPATPALAVEVPEAERGAAILAPFKQQLMAALQAGLAGGPEQAIAACRMQAPAIADSLSVDGVRVGRTSHKLRNPANAGPEWATRAVQDYLREEAELAPRSFELGDGRVGYVEPIMTGELCLGCHGETLAPAVAEAITELYPEDRATGFAAGDLRGIFWAEFPK